MEAEERRLCKTIWRLEVDFAEDSSRVILKITLSLCEVEDINSGIQDKDVFGVYVPCTEKQEESIRRSAQNGETESWSTMSWKPQTRKKGVQNSVKRTATWELVMQWRSTLQFTKSTRDVGEF